MTSCNATRSRKAQLGHGIIALLSTQWRQQEIFRVREKLGFVRAEYQDGVQDTVTGFLLAGVGNVDLRKNTNFLVVSESAPSACPTAFWQNKDHISTYSQHVVRPYEKLHLVIRWRGSAKK